MRRGVLDLPGLQPPRERCSVRSSLLIVSAQLCKSSAFVVVTIFATSWPHCRHLHDGRMISITDLVLAILVFSTVGS